MFTLWIISAILSVVSLTLMAILIGSRIIEQRHDKDRKAAEALARKALIAFAANVDEQALLAGLDKIDVEIVSEAARELLGLIRGDIAPRLRTALVKLGVPEHERSLLRNGLLTTRLRAVEFLAFFSDEKSEAALTDALCDRSHEVQIAAAISLAEMGVPFDLGRLLKRLERGRTLSKRISELLGIVFKHERDTAIELLHDRELSNGLKALVIDGVCRTKSPDLAAILTELLKESHSVEIAASVIRSSATLGHAQSLSMVIDHLGSPKPELKLAAAEAATFLGIPDDRVISGLARLMGSEEWTIRNAAASALMSLGPKGEAHLKQMDQTRMSRSRQAVLTLIEEAQNV